MDSGGKDQARVGGEQVLQQGRRDGGCLVHQQQVGGLGPLAEGIRWQEADLALAELDAIGVYPALFEPGAGMLEEGGDGSQARGRHQDARHARGQQLARGQTQGRGLAPAAIGDDDQGSPGPAPGRVQDSFHRLGLIRSAVDGSRVHGRGAGR